jgi:uncharacterized iron-regulated membrane protein
MTFKKITGKVHLWLGLASGLIVFIVGLTGAILVFEEEISRLLNYGVFQEVEKTDQPFAPPSKIFSIAGSALQNKKIARTYYTVFTSGRQVNALWALDSTRQYHAVLQNPYTGKIVGSYDYKNAFFTIITHIHISLLMGEVGTTIISYATLTFVLLMITGIILWKPASRKGYKQRFTIKWNAKGKRLNYDLHNVLGFYMAWIAIFIALTGLVWSFEWMNNSVQWIANGGKTTAVKKEKITSDSTLISGVANTYKIADSVFNSFAGNAGSMKAIRVYKPNSISDALHFTIETDKGSNYARADDYYFDQYTGGLLSIEPFSALDNGEKIRRMNYYIHVGSIGGLTGKFLAFFASLVAASLPITGFIIWNGRRKVKAPFKMKISSLAK